LISEKNNSNAISDEGEIAERVRDHSIQYFAQVHGCMLVEIKFYNGTDKEH
jgi:hypothetical protein